MTGWSPDSVALVVYVMLKWYALQAGVVALLAVGTAVAAFVAGLLHASARRKT